jgi:dTDP-4-dehydrorhamnose reductase
LIQHAHKQGFVVAASYYSHSPPLDIHPDVYWLPLDICDLPAVQEGFDIFQPDVVIHTAFIQHGPKLWAINAEGTRHVAKVSQSLGARLIHLSSDVIFDGESTCSYTDHDSPNPLTDYGRSKAGAERFVLEECPSAVLIRTSLIYGFSPIDRHTQFVLDVADGLREACLYTDEYRCPIFVDDLVSALIELISHSYTGCLNVAGSERVSRYEFGVLLANAYGRNQSHISYGLSSESAVPRPRNCVLDTRLAQSLLKTSLRGVSDVLAQKISRHIDNQEYVSGC